MGRLESHLASGEVHSDVKEGPRMLIVDDTPSIHEAIRRVLRPPGRVQRRVEGVERDLFGDDPSSDARVPGYRIDSAFQGQEALALVEHASERGDPYALVFLDVRMPPGWDGVETLGHLWRVQPDLQVVLCTAYADYAWADVVGRIGQSDGLFILKKPFEVIEVQQLALSLTRRWRTVRAMREQLCAMRELIRGEGVVAPRR